MDNKTFDIIDALMHGVTMKVIVTKRCSDFSSGF